MLYPLDKEVIESPYLYISYFLKTNRRQYYEQMTSVRENGTYEAWVKFFLRAAGEAAQDSLDTIERLHKLSESSRERIMAGIHGQTASTKREIFLTYLGKSPIIEIKRTASDLGWSFPTTSKYVKLFAEAGLLNEITGRRRGRTFVYEEYLAVLRKDLQPL